MPTLNGIGKSAANIIAIGAVCTLLINFSDSRYAMASDVKDLKASFRLKEAQLTEDKISIIEDEIYVLQIEDVLTNREKAQISKLENRKAKYLRVLQSIKPNPR